MTDWTAGYVTDIPYTYGVYRELFPALQSFAALAAGFAAPDANAPLTYCELGCGQGYSANILAAGHPHIEVHATDFNPAHILGARSLAAAAGMGNAHFYDSSFAEFAADESLPDFDIIAVHGVYSWISAENRRHIVDFIRRRLKVGGLVYISYNALPGYAPVMPLRRLLVDRAGAGSGSTVTRIDQALAYVGRLTDADAAYFRPGAGIPETLKRIQDGNRDYVAHEYFNRDWTAFYHADVAADLADAKLSYAGPADLLTAVDTINLTADQRSLLASAGTVTERETLRDYIVNQVFRRDVFIKGAVPLNQLEARDRWLKSRFLLTHGRGDVPNFSIGHDTAAIIPLLKQAISLNPNLKVVAVPWSSPAWMKSSGTMNGGSVDPANFSSLAQYFVKFTQAYQGQGVPIYAILPQNEPLFSTSSYPSTAMSAADQASFIGNFLGPAMTSAGLSQVKIVAYDHNWDHPEYPQTVLGDAKASQYVAGAAFHCYAGDPSGQMTFHNAYPAKDIWFTECSGTVGSSFAGDLKWSADKLLIGAVRNYARSVSLWNLVLDQNSGPKNGGCSDCRALVTVDNSVSPSKVTYNVEYYVLAHLAKFVMPGAYRVESTSTPGGIETVGFLNPDGSKALLALNDGTSSSTFTVQRGTQRFNYTLPAGAVATFSWR